MQNDQTPLPVADQSRCLGRQGPVRLPVIMQISADVPTATMRTPCPPSPGRTSLDPVAGRRHAQSVLDQDDGVAGVHQSLQLRDQFVDVGGVQAGSWFILHIPGRPVLGVLEDGTGVPAF